MRISRGSAAAALAAGALLLAGCGQGGNESTLTITGTAPASPSESGSPSSSATGSASASASATPSSEPAAPDGSPEVVEEIATGLEAPWGLGFLPDGDAIVTERDTQRVLLVSGDDYAVTELGTLDVAAPQGEAGLLGVAISPDFAQDRFVYFYASTTSDNRIVRATLRGERLGEPTPIFTGIPNGYIHDGGRLEFGPDGMLYVSTGETGEPSLAQQRDSLGGKVLRLTPAGKPAPGNPFGTAVWSWGHRNVQGLAFDDADRLWASEFGQDTFDELNRIDEGANYGWPAVEGKGGRSQGFVDPQQVWDTDDASPSGLAFLDGYLWMAALKGERLWRVRVEGDRAVDATPFFVGDYGRMRTVAATDDGMLWVMTSNRDTRGEPGPGDDKILLVRP
ncbi:PQQ-dependent sugar dehydrogenase [Nocardioides sp.]|uniref:PQQ-dependent sugar dehydrogenase n=1 Tax=Nocardioides sp. TaxID=35761 RepID=UPI00286B6266|nr:PQQ-dependent sugar dehydrogenase [Nocardioides sp.]